MNPVAFLFWHSSLYFRRQDCHLNFSIQNSSEQHYSHDINCFVTFWSYSPHLWFIKTLITVCRGIINSKTGTISLFHDTVHSWLRGWSNQMLMCLYVLRIVNNAPRYMHRVIIRHTGRINQHCTSLLLVWHTEAERNTRNLVYDVSRLILPDASSCIWIKN